MNEESFEYDFPLDRNGVPWRKDDIYFFNPNGEKCLLISMNFNFIENEWTLIGDVIGNNDYFRRHYKPEECAHVSTLDSVNKLYMAIKGNFEGKTGYVIENLAILFGLDRYSLHSDILEVVANSIEQEINDKLR